MIFQRYKWQRYKVNFRKQFDFVDSRWPSGYKHSPAMLDVTGSRHSFSDISDRFKYGIDAVSCTE